MGADGNFMTAKKVKSKKYNRPAQSCGGFFMPGGGEEMPYIPVILVRIFMPFYGGSTTAE